MNYNLSNTNISSLVENEENKGWRFIYLLIIGIVMFVYGLWVIFSKKVLTRGGIKIPCKIATKEESKCIWWFSAFFFTILGLGMFICGIILNTFLY